MWDCAPESNKIPKDSAARIMKEVMNHSALMTTAHARNGLRSVDTRLKSRLLLGEEERKRYKDRLLTTKNAFMTY